MLQRDVAMDFRDAPLTVRPGRWLFAHRGFGGILLLPAFLPWLGVKTQSLTWLTGGILGAAGIALRLWSISYLGRSARTRKDKAKSLVTDGPFSVCRNPIYLANMLTLTGFVILLGAVWYLPVYVILLFGFYSAIVHYEERLLTQKFPEEFGPFRQSTRRWLPGLRLSRLGKANHSLREVIYRERSHLMQMAAGLLAVGIKEAATLLLGGS